MRIAWIFAILLIVPLAHATVYIYSKGFDANRYNESLGTLYLDVKGPSALAAFLRSAGFDTVVVNTVPPAKAGDVIIVLGCTDISTSDARTLVNLAENGVGLIVDAHCPSPLLGVLNVGLSETYKGIRKGVLSTEYATVTGYYDQAGERDVCDAPACFGYESAYYVGSTLYAPDPSWRDVFADASLVIYRKLGQGHVAVTGCLFCASPLLLENMVDWADNGKIDFPQIEIKRTARVSPDGYVYDTFTLVAPSGASAKVEYTPGQCPLIKIDQNPPQPLAGGKVSKVFVAVLKPSKNICVTPDALIIFSYKGMKRDVIVRGETVVVGQPVNVQTQGINIPFPRSLDDILTWVAAILLVIFVALVVTQARHAKREGSEERRNEPRRIDKRRLIRKKLRALRLKEKEIEETLNVLTTQWMRGQMSEEEYRKTKTLYEAKLANIRAKIKILKEALSSSGAHNNNEDTDEERNGGEE